MLDSILDTLANVQSELVTGVERLRQNVIPTATPEQKVVNDAIEEILSTPTGNELLHRYQMNLDDMKNRANEGARLANQCSTRMGRAQQMCKERADAIMNIDTFLRDTSNMDKKIRDLSSKIDKLVRFCNQTEQAMTHLEGLDVIVRTEEEVDMIRQQAKTAVTIIQMEPGPAILGAPLTRPGDDARQHQEEVMLEEFLSNDRQ